jgi:hypothetical protein
MTTLRIVALRRDIHFADSLIPIALRHHPDLGNEIVESPTSTPGEAVLKAPSRQRAKLFAPRAIRRKTLKSQ